TDTPPAEGYTRSLHDALPIYGRGGDAGGNPPAGLRGRQLDAVEFAIRLRERYGERCDVFLANDPAVAEANLQRQPRFENGSQVRSEEHTSELQSRSDLVCRLL